jgi:hypothetical protein
MAAPAAFRDACGGGAWYQATPSGRVWGLRPDGGDYVVVAGDAGGVHELDVELRGRSFPYDVGPGGDHLLVVQDDAVWSIDLVAHTAVRVCDAPGATQVAHVAGGFALAIDGEVQGLSWTRGEAPTRVWELDVDADDLGWAEDGRILLIAAGDTTAVIAVRGDERFAIGALPFGPWHVAWTVDGVTYVQTEVHDGPARPYRLVDAAAAWRAAVAGPALGGDLDVAAMTAFEIAGDAAWGGAVVIDLGLGGRAAAAADDYDSDSDSDADDFADDFDDDDLGDDDLGDDDLGDDADDESGATE